MQLSLEYVSMAFLKEISPLIPVADVLKSAEFFENILGFSSVIKNEKFAIVKRDLASLRLIPAGDNVGQLACYIVADDVDELYQELRPELEKLPEGRLRRPFNQTYGMREFHVIDLDSLLIFFGSQIEGH